jgi:hypothetical protein
LGGGRNQTCSDGVGRACNHLERRVSRKNRETILQQGIYVSALVIGQKDECGASAIAESVKCRDGICADIHDCHVRPSESRALPVGQCLTHPDDIDTLQFIEPGTQPR